MIQFFRPRISLLIPLMSIVFALASCTVATDDSEVRGGEVPKEVLAFYYGWYGNPQVSGSWRHWRDVNEAAKTIGGSTNYPQFGPYDSHDPKVVDQHYEWAKDAGVTGFIVTWWVQGDFHDQGMPLMLDTARKHGMKLTIYYETVPPRDSPQPEGAVKDLLYVLEKYGKHQAWLRVDGKPVVFVYGRAINQIKLDGWNEVVQRVNGQYPGGAVFIGDRISEEAAAIFDGIHTYNPTGRIAGKSATEIREWARTTYPQWVATAGSKISCLTIIPGYDDTKLDRKPPRPTTARHGGETYRILWEEALAANPDWVLITSWNEWHEGSEIEPSAEDGDLALKTTKQFARKFLNAR
jgi:glycoprotein endo-alpha-1,2-mannosidase